ncbi:ankyrin [Beutenbergia cavernae DSM 12333]|uniref:Ankyrin n=1 Tax=Beutenbergia cavernae (strain ATCC BAA-8 / DSM 12333 / CCUG 43141 / JCM 11478 / NBRC 16432 / NCIMB 13614 / HKI 0122) TaxID=471853 RepID=C5BUW0_BEUC1|nr:hypothetical protein [Beutenbergia cavernae]ACQ78334.1 ankyrin [Beutenbergia cavernae DSM 12333]
MSELPAHPDLDHLRKQAKRLLRGYRAGDPEAYARLRHALPAAAGLDDAALAARGFALHDAQSCVAREHGAASWVELRDVVEARAANAGGDATARWLRLVYAGDTLGGTYAAQPRSAARWLTERPDLLGDDPWLACAVGDETTIRAALRDPGWVNRAGGPLGLPPLVALTHSSLVRQPEYADGIRRCARLLLDAGADPNQSTLTRWSEPGDDEPGEYPLSALYGAAGLTHDRELTAQLLAAGADPDDGESLYHSLDDPDCARLLLDAGATITGTNAMYRVFDVGDRDDVGLLRLLLDAGGDPNEPSEGWGAPLLFAIRRRRSVAHVRTLLDAGADPRATTHGVSAYRLARLFGLVEVAELLRAAGAADDLSPAEEFAAACAAGDRPTVRRLLGERPDVVGTLSAEQLRLLPDLAEEGAGEAVRVMVEAGWPVDVRGSWDGTALNHAVFRGDAALTAFLLDHGADWRARHGFGDTVLGTLSWASLNREDAAADWPGCARALLHHGVEVPDGYVFADDVAEVVAEAPGQVRVESGHA